MFFFTFCLRYAFTSKKVVVIEMPQWKLKTELARNTIFEGNYDKLKFCVRNSIFWPVWCQKWLFSQDEKYNMPR